LTAPFGFFFSSFSTVFFSTSSSTFAFAAFVAFAFIAFTSGFAASLASGSDRDAASASASASAPGGGSRKDTGNGARVERRFGSAPRRSISRSAAHACLQPGSSNVRAGHVQLTSRRPRSSRRTTSRVRCPRTFATTELVVSSWMETAPLFQRAKPSV
jgi:hypothetical protein